MTQDNHVAQETQIEQARAAMHASQPRDRATRLRYNHEEMMGQPSALRETLEREQARIDEVAAWLVSRVHGRIYAIGCGDSWAIAQSLKSPYEALLELPFEPVQALEFNRFGRRFVGHGDLVIGISASGTTAETVHGLQAAREAGAITLGVTNKENSPFVQAADRTLLGHAMRRASFPTQASTVGIAALLALASCWARHQGARQLEAEAVRAWLNDLPPLAHQILKTSEPLARSLAERWVERDVFTFIGAGPGLAAARFGAAKIREGCEGYGWIIGTEEFHHYEVVQPGDPIFLVAPPDAAYTRALDVARGVRAMGGVLYSVLPEGEEAITALSEAVFAVPPVPEALVALPYTLPLQLAAWHIAQAKLEAGHLR